LVWRQEEPESLTILLPGQPDRVYWRGAVSPGDGFLPKDVPADLMAEPTIPSGHPEAFHDAFAACTAASRLTCASGKRGRHSSATAPNTQTWKTAGWAIAFIETCVKSSKKNGAWTPMPKAI